MRRILCTARAVTLLPSLAAGAAFLTARPAAADSPYQGGPDPTPQSVAATRGTFATASVSVAPGNGFNGGMIYYPTDTSLGTWAAVAIVPGYAALLAALDYLTQQSPVRDRVPTMIISGQHDTAYLDGPYTGMPAATISRYKSKCPCVPPGGTTPPPSARELVNAAAGRCLDVPSASTTNGTQPQLWDCHGNTNQQWGQRD